MLGTVAKAYLCSSEQLTVVKGISKRCADTMVADAMLNPYTTSLESILAPTISDLSVSYGTP